ncbi:Scr1 family TA system antitoxin-like transcriptional regulator [Solwaraspora sp. WMMD937]|uniref:Scr1 family TA system antitoxin-like transcriptional regulator n=1 Tax=Solwaraspora sp. WMMD937 TaxID=3016090 RepID=UPI00249AC73B|nr:Scr1 family TA system antitoxin-like transcriptional regulator [Solwaraspora sp. WMMD937]WFE24238.1 Scr1 family TA system antitoxin-like transcriptional regulator [Solwaraspora sp. WMMD937]
MPSTWSHCRSAIRSPGHTRAPSSGIVRRYVRFGGSADHQPNTRPEELEPTQAARLDRQEIVTRATNACRLVVVLDEIVLRRSVGGPEVMRDQLTAIADANQRQNVQVHIVPFTTKGYPGVLGPMVLATVAGRPAGRLPRRPPGGAVDRSQGWHRGAGRGSGSYPGYALPARLSQEMVMEAIETWS